MLALVGSGEYLPAIRQVDQFLLDRIGIQSNVVCLPTASGKESPERVAYWSTLGERHFKELGVNVKAVPLIRRQDAFNEKIIEQLELANFVYMSGGDPLYLYRTLVGTPAWQAILNVHLRGGVVAGCSAGAMIMGERMLGFPVFSKGFGLLEDTLIIPHYDEMPVWLPWLIRLMLFNQIQCAAIDASTALVVDERDWLVLGKGRVDIWRNRKHWTYRDGQRIPI